MHKQGEQTYADVTKPLRELTKQDPERKTRLYMDHRPVGIASMVAQKYVEEGQDVWKAVYHNGRKLEPAKARYHKIEGESLAIFSGV